MEEEEFVVGGEFGGGDVGDAEERGEGGGVDVGASESVEFEGGLEFKEELAEVVDNVRFHVDFGVATSVVDECEAEGVGARRLEAFREVLAEFGEAPAELVRGVDAALAAAFDAAAELGSKVVNELEVGAAVDQEERVNHIAHRFGHFPAVGIADERV